MAYTKKVIYAAPTVEPLSLEELKRYLRIDGDDDDGDLLDLIRTVRGTLEEKTWRAFCTQTWDVYFDYFEDELVLPLPPVASITSIKYYDENGTQQTLSSSVYELGVYNEIGKVRLQYQQSWPVSRGHKDQVVVRSVHGYGGPGDVPRQLKQAIKFLAAHWYSQREPLNIGNIVNPLPWTVDALIADYRLYGAVA